MSDVQSARAAMRVRGMCNRRAVSEASAIYCSEEESVTQQQFRDEVDANTIVRRFGIDQVPQVRLDGIYGDFTGITDYQSAAERLSAISDSFMSLPAAFREQFGNDPSAFLAFAQSVDPDELQQTIAESAVVPAPPAPPAAAPAAPAPAAAPAAPSAPSAAS